MVQSQNKNTVCPSGSITTEQPNTVSVLQKLLDSSLDVICSIDKEGRFISVSAAARAVWGYEPRELEGRPCLDLVVEDDREATLQAACDIIAGHSRTHFENRNICKDGSIKPILWSSRWDPESGVFYAVAKDATEMKIAEKKRRLQERRLHRAYKLAGIAWWELDLATRTFTSSDEVFVIFGLPVPPRNHITVEEFLAYVHPEDVPLLPFVLTGLPGDTYFTYEHRIIKPSGEIAHLIHYSELIRDEKGTPVALHGSMKDITESKRRQLQLEASEQRFSEILESIGDGFFTLDREWTITYWNTRAEEILGRNGEELCGNNLWEVYPEAIPLKFYTEYHRVMEQGVAARFEEYYPPLCIWIEVNAYPSSEGMSVYFKDITPKKKQEIQLKVAHERFELVSRATSDAIWDWDLLQDVVYFNEPFTHLFGYPSGFGPVSKSWSDRIHPRDQDWVGVSVRSAVNNADATTWSEAYRFIRADGTVAHVYDRGFIIRDEQGRAVRMVGSLQDVSSQKEAEERVRLSEQKYKLLFFGSNRPKWTFNADTYRLTDANDAALQLYGYSREEFLSLTVPDLRSPGDHTPFYQAVESMKQDRQRTYSNIVRHKKKNGALFYLELDSHSIELPTGMHFLVTAMDMTEKLELQQRLIEEKMAAQKEVAKAIVHTQEKERSEISKELHDGVNQILTTIKLYIENIRDYPGHADSFIDKSVELTQRAINEVRYLARQLVTPVMADMGFRATMEDLAAQYQSANRFDIHLTLELREEQMEYILQLTIYRIVQEQLNNIVKYAQASRVTVAIVASASDVLVRVEDNGVGFDTAKVAYGLGLHNIKNRSELLRGTMVLHTAQGKGCVLEVTFPVNNSFKERKKRSCHEQSDHPDRR